MHKTEPGELLALAHGHGVLALLVRRLRAAGLVDLISAAEWQQMQQVLMRQSMYAMAQTSALLQIEQAANRQGIRVLAWKGPALSMQLYGDATLRSSADLDLLVHHRELPQLVRALEGIGFVLSQQGASEHETELARRVYNEVKMARTKDNIHLELHNEFMPVVIGEWQQLEPCLQRAVSLEMTRGQSIHVPHAMDLFLSLCGHGAKHGWYALKWICDIRGFLDRFGSTLDWTGLLRKTEEEGISRPLLNAVVLSDRLFQTGVPEVIAQAAARDKRVGAMVDWQEQKLRSGSLERIESDRGWSAALDLIGSPRKRVAFLVRKAFMPQISDLELVQVPRQFSMLYVPVRLFRLTGLIAQKAVGRLRRQ